MTWVSWVQIYSAPIMETFETKLLDQKGGLWAFKNWFTRTALRCFYIFLAAFFAAMFPYFGDILGKYLAARFYSTFGDILDYCCASDKTTSLLHKTTLNLRIAAPCLCFLPLHLPGSLPCPCPCPSLSMAPCP